MTVGSFLLSGISFMTLICIIVVIFTERKNPASSLAWIMVLAFLPVIGFILYLFLGSGFKINKRRRYANKAALDDVYDKVLKKHLKIDSEKHYLSTHRDATRLLTYLGQEGDGVFTDSNTADVFSWGDNMFESLMRDISLVQDHIHILFYIIREDEIGSKIVTLLKEKAKQGVEVRLIYDSVGSFLSIRKKFKELSEAGGEVLAFAPILSKLNSSLRLNYRNHRKIVVIDGKIGYVGGMNIGDEYRGKDPKLSPWRDTHMRITGPAVWFLQERFLMDWSYVHDIDVKDSMTDERYFPKPYTDGDIGMQIVSSGPDAKESAIKCGMLTMFYGAQKYIYIQTPYFAPDSSFFDALRIAAKSGVDVRLMIPRLGDHWLVHRATYGYARQILDYGVRIFQYQGFLHAKTVTVDGEAVTIGTTNMANRSFTQNFEVNAFICNENFAEKHWEIFLKDQENCIELTKEWFRCRPMRVRAAYNFTRLVAPLI